MFSPKLIFKRGRRLLYRYYLNGREVGRLGGSDDPGRRELGNALAAWLRDELSAEERAAIERIEALRAELAASTDEVEVTDHGAGSQRDPASTGGGVRVTRVVGQVCRGSSMSRPWATLLFRLIRESKPAVCLELGTCLGFSGAYQAAALKLNGRGRLITLEGAENLAALARRNFARLGLDNARVITGRFQDTLAAALGESGPVDFAFIDGHHEEQATLDYFRAIAPFTSARAILVFDDVAWSAGMARAWRTIAADPRSRQSVDLAVVGVCRLGPADSVQLGIKLELP